ncbi:MAG: corrinoid protein [Oscillospiraceae bacterium]|nr:corrinoid protein [Oscillospiraceae bacterium]
MSILVEISEALQKGKKKLVVQYVQQALEEGVAPQQILNEGLLPGMDVVGQKFKNNEVFVPEVLVAARAMNAGAELLKPLLAEAGVGTPGKMVLGTVKGDLHDIGKNLVKMMVEGKGIEVIDLGVDVSAEAFVEAAKEHGADIIGCSALLTTTMPVMAEVVKAVEAAGLKDKVKVMIGGAPVTEEFCKSVGADYYTADAASAAMVAAEILK